MKVNGTPMRTIWPEGAGAADGVSIIDQTRLPHRFETVRLTGLADAAHAIRAMLVRGAPLIGATAAYGVALEMARDPSDAALAGACDTLAATRPTAINLAWALARMRAALAPLPEAERAAAAWAEAAALLARMEAEGAVICVNSEAWAAGGRPARLLVFVSPDLTPPDSVEDLAHGLTLPWKVLVQEDAAGAVWIVWQDPGQIPSAKAA